MTLDPLGCGGYDEPGSYSTRSSHLLLPERINWSFHGLLIGSAVRASACRWLANHPELTLVPHRHMPVVVSKPAGQCEGKSVTRTSMTGISRPSPRYLRKQIEDMGVLDQIE